MHEDALIHGTCLSIGEAGVLLLGKPGSGKSDLALRLIDGQGGGLTGVIRCARLVADDQVVVRRAGEHLLASSPPVLYGKMEVRGLGIVRVPAEDNVPLRLAVRLTPSADIERLPDLPLTRMDILGLAIPLVLIDPESASAPARIRAALDHLDQG